MKHIIRYRCITIPGKLTGEYRLTITEGNGRFSSPEYVSSFEGGKSINIALFPVLSLEIQRPSEMDELGNRVRAPWNENDSIVMTKFNIPILLNELKGIYEEIKIPEMYSYHNDRLELNSKLSAKARHVFMIGRTTIELVPVVIEQENGRIEGIKMKYNNESSVVFLTLNELISLMYHLEHIDMDNLSMNLYFEYIRHAQKEENSIRRDMITPQVDIEPLNVVPTKPEKKPAIDVKAAFEDLKDQMFNEEFKEESPKEEKEEKKD